VAFLNAPLGTSWLGADIHEFAHLYSKGDITDRKPSAYGKAALAILDSSLQLTNASNYEFAVQSAFFGYTAQEAVAKG